MGWKYSKNEFIKIYRKLLDWEWYTDVNTTKLFLHCLLRANWRNGSWHGHEYKRGQFITSLPQLSLETGLTVRQVRTALNHLKSTGEVTDKIYPKFRVITVVSYDQFQTSDRQIDRQATDKRQGSDRQPTPDRRSVRSVRTKEKIAPSADSDFEFEPLTPEEIEEGGWGFE